jgi:hypothetical protein
MMMWFSFCNSFSSESDSWLDQFPMKKFWFLNLRFNVNTNVGSPSLTRNNWSRSCWLGLSRHYWLNTAGGAGTLIWTEFLRPTSLGSQDSYFLQQERLKSNCQIMLDRFPDYLSNVRRLIQLSPFSVKSEQRIMGAADICFMFTSARVCWARFLPGWNRWQWFRPFRFVF